MVMARCGMVVVMSKVVMMVARMWYGDGKGVVMVWCGDPSL